MALTNINDNFQLDAPKHLDNRTGNYSSVAEANASIPQEYRVQGLEVVVITAGEAVKYYYRDGVADGDLVIMPTGGGGGSVAFADITGQPSDNANLDAVLDTKGDMFKSVYDTDDDGIVDKAERIEIIVRNATGSTLSKGKVVYLSGSTGNRPNAVLAAASSEITATKTIGIVVADIPNNTDGSVAINGTLHNLNLNSFTAGDMLWLSNTAGNYVANTPPAEPSHAVFIGYVVRAHPNEGRMVIAIQNGYELDELHGVEITSPAIGQALVYNNSNGLWENGVPTIPTENYLQAGLPYVVYNSSAAAAIATTIDFTINTSQLRNGSTIILQGYISRASGAGTVTFSWTANSNANIASQSFTSGTQYGIQFYWTAKYISGTNSLRFFRTPTTSFVNNTTIATTFFDVVAISGVFTINFRATVTTGSMTGATENLTAQIIY